ncbi:MAG: DUF1934 family protein [bacterium]
MIVEFKMIIDDDIIEFKSIGKLQNNELVFQDRNNKENNIKVQFLNNMIKVIQEGSTTMENTHILDQKIDGFYKGAHNVNGVTSCYTKKLDWHNNSLYIEYDFYFNGNLASKNKLFIKY